MTEAEVSARMNLVGARLHSAMKVTGIEWAWDLEKQKDGSFKFTTRRVYFATRDPKARTRKRRPAAGPSAQAEPGVAH